jgi:hypothetical protein
MKKTIRRAASTAAWMLFVSVPVEADAQQTPRLELSLPSPPAAWATLPGAPFSSHVPTARSATVQLRPDSSGMRTIVTHALVGTAAGLLTGLVLSGSNVSDDDSSIILVWTSLGLAAGVTSGVITWLLERAR